MACDLAQLGITLIRDLGFPIFVAAWLLLRVAPVIRELTSAVHTLAERLSRLEH